jgi:hypothetical protein
MFGTTSGEWFDERTALCRDGVRRSTMRTGVPVGIVVTVGMAVFLACLVAAAPGAAQDAAPNPPQPGVQAPPGMPADGLPPSPLMRPWQMRQRQRQMQQADPAQPQVAPPEAPAKPSPAPIVVSTQAPAQNQVPLQPTLKVDFAAGKLSVTAYRTALSQVLREVGQRTGLEMRGLQDAPGVVSVQFSGVSVAQGVQELLGGINYAVIGSLASLQEIRQARVVVLSATATDTIDVGGPLRGVKVNPPQPGLDSPPGLMTQEARNRRRAELMSPDPNQQDKGFNEVSKLGPKDAFDALQDVITNGDGVSRLRALQFMDQSSALDENMVMGALRESLNDQDSTLRDYAIQALGRQSSPESLDALRQAFEGGDAAVRLGVLEAVSQRADARPIIQQAANDSDQGVRSMANELLGNPQVNGQPAQPGQPEQPPAPVQMQTPQDNPDPNSTEPESGDQSDPPNR